MRPRLAIATTLAFVVMAMALWLGLDDRIPEPPAFDIVRTGWKPSEVYLLDGSGEIIHEQRVDATRRRLEWVELGDVSPALQAAVLTSEDRRFYAHGGVDARAIAAAAVQRLSGGVSRGASTITMQLASLLDPTLRRRGGPRSLPQKTRQMRMAWIIEARWSKPQILEAYLNLVTFSGELQGVGAASHVLFGKAPHGLDEPEALVLAALLRSPNATRAIGGRAGGEACRGPPGDPRISRGCAGPARSGTGEPGSPRGAGASMPPRVCSRRGHRAGALSSACARRSTAPSSISWSTR